jgi:hypothetical protein
VKAKYSLFDRKIGNPPYSAQIYSVIGFSLKAPWVKTMYELLVMNKDFRFSKGFLLETPNSLPAVGRRTPN